MSRRAGPRSLGSGLHRLASRGLTMAAAVGALPLLPILSGRPGFRDLPARLLVSAPPAAADLIHVLGGANASETLRIDHGVSLYRAGHAPRLLLTGSEWGIDWAERNAERARRLGVPDSALLLDPHPRSTRMEASVLRRAAARLGARSVLLVTEAFHAGRAARIFQRRLRGSDLELRSCPAGAERFPPASWWEDPSTRALLLGEMARLWLARATGGA